MQAFNEVSTTRGQAVTDRDNLGEQPILIEEDLPDLFLAQDHELLHLGEIQWQLKDLVVIEIVRYNLIFGDVLQIFVTLR